MADNCQLAMNIREIMKCAEELIRVPGGALLSTGRSGEALTMGAAMWERLDSSRRNTWEAERMKLRKGLWATENILSFSESEAGSPRTVSTEKEYHVTSALDSRGQRGGAWRKPSWLVPCKGVGDAYELWILLTPTPTCCVPDLPTSVGTQLWLSCYTEEHLCKEGRALAKSLDYSDGFDCVCAYSHIPSPVSYHRCLLANVHSWLTNYKTSIPLFGLTAGLFYWRQCLW